MSARHDNLLATAQMLVTATFWFHPMVCGGLARAWSKSASAHATSRCWRSGRVLQPMPPAPQDLRVVPGVAAGECCRASPAET